jgi:hypothetical protein
MNSQGSFIIPESRDCVASVLYPVRQLEIEARLDELG